MRAALLGVTLGLGFMTKGPVALILPGFALLLLLAAWGPCEDPAGCPTDLNGDGAVDLADLLLLLSGWGPCP